MTDELIEQTARAIASAMGDNYADAFKNKSRWIAKRGMSGGRYRDVNEPMRCDYDEAARAAIRVIAPAVLEQAMDAVVGYVHPDYERLPGSPFATTAIRALKEGYSHDQ